MKKEDKKEEDAAFWKAVIGDMVYFGDSDVLIYRSPEWVLGKWYIENEATGGF